MLPVAILCGGKGTRVADIAGELPKALIAVAGTPLLEHQLRWLRDGGVTDVALLIGYRGEAIRAFAGDGSRFGLRIAYSEDGPQPRGTAGALQRALPLLGDAFVTVYGDALLSADVDAVARALTDDYDGVMTVYRNEDRWLPSNVRVDGERVAAYDKAAPAGTMTSIDYGINAFRATAFDRIALDRAVDLSEIHRKLIRRGRLRALPISQRWYEIGSPEGLRDAEQHLAGTPAPPSLKRPRQQTPKDGA